ncbi:MAG: dihydrofolate reductase [Gammaproteobacteria bacterium]|nr:dihydrofolate reductase [Gammaproteobacteria bacterium]
MILAVLFCCFPCLAQEPEPFQYEVDRFSDVRILRYQIPGFEKLTLQQKQLCYYLAEAGYCGRDIMWDQNCRHNLTVRRTIEQIVRHYEGDRQEAEFQKFLEYAKRVWMANGVHHHYSTDKMIPECEYWAFIKFLYGSPKAQFPLRKNEKLHEFASRMYPIMFDPGCMPKKVEHSNDGDLVTDSAVNFYEGVSNSEVEAFYKTIREPDDKTPISYGLNSKLMKIDGKVIERPWKVGGMYGEALLRVVYWLKKAEAVADDKQRDVIAALIRYYQTGDLRDFDRHCILWVQDTQSTVDFINGFIEVYNDPKGMRGSFECLVEVVDPDTTARIGALAQNAQWFEDNAPILPQHRKEKIASIEWRAINVVAAIGDSSPAMPIGINLPNSNWIREIHGSKSVNLANILFAYNQIRGSNLAKEFYYTPEAAERVVKYSDLSGCLTTALHEVIGHASGKLEPGVEDPQMVLGHYASTLEEARADLFALYFILDPKLIELGLMPSLEIGQSEYDAYILSGLMLQLRRIQPGKDIEEAHMRNRQLIAKWVYERGQTENVIEKRMKDGKTHFIIRDYEKLRQLFGALLREIQRIKSQGDKEAGQALVENYGVKVDKILHEEVLARFKSIQSGPPYAGFINPHLVPIYKDEEIIDVTVEYPSSFVEQMLEYGEKYSFLPNEN